ncbi:hypothetical protein SGCZBJ_15580 [Caulobacter zeae]|uniref:Uncharacterized protein n=1 Tax=Caulobacter zeae TaxID=2055137 RepID=A0A2N5DBH2_9CAUL|nr:hypothetical protein SGCZBJ_15580 [Caulobacter zeae]
MSHVRLLRIGYSPRLILSSLSAHGLAAHSRHCFASNSGHSTVGVFDRSRPVAEVGAVRKPSLLERGRGPSRSDGRVSGYTLSRRAGASPATAPRPSRGFAYPLTLPRLAARAPPSP